MPDDLPSRPYRDALVRAGITVAGIVVVAVALGLLIGGTHGGRIAISTGETVRLLATIFLLAGLALGAIIAVERLLLGWARASMALSAPRRRVALVYVGLGLVELAACWWGRYVEPFRLAPRETTIALPGVRTPVRMVVFSDVHSDGRFDLDMRIADQVNALHPDVIVFVGDTLNEAGRAPAFRQALSAMNARVAKLAIRGNWDSWFWDDIDLFGGTGFEEVGSGWRTVTVGETALRMGGHAWRDDFAPQVVVEAPPAGEGPSIFLYHANDYIPAAAQRGIDLYLCGDTHGGQLDLPWMGPLFAVGRQGLKYVRGLYEVPRPSGAMKAYVTSGIGVERSLPFRFGVRPEITVLDLVPTEGAAAARLEPVRPHAECLQCEIEDRRRQAHKEQLDVTARYLGLKERWFDEKPTKLPCTRDREVWGVVRFALNGEPPWQRQGLALRSYNEPANRLEVALPCPELSRPAYAKLYQYDPDDRERNGLGHAPVLQRGKNYRLTFVANPEGFADDPIHPEKARLERTLVAVNPL
jgi:predicted MPP superfamily phosphohydrolase